MAALVRELNRPGRRKPLIEVTIYLLLVGAPLLPLYRRLRYPFGDVAVSP
jgi:hypothetical protein